MRLLKRLHRWPRTRRRIAVLAAAALAAAGVGLYPAVAATPSGAPTVTVAQGQLAGQVKNGVNEFFGIPYAAPPTGPLRWKPPQPAASWTGVRQATKFGHQCPQLFLGDENCLYLNVYAPTTPVTSPRPVMVWIHGGAFTLGAGPEYDPSVYAKLGGVAITINYRLGPFGFLSLPSLAAESPDHASGNYALMDQQAALKWVQQNAAVFGGNPHNVTIFGESAGGASVCAQIASPTAAGLFQRAIAESGCAMPSFGQPVANGLGTAFAKKLGCTDPATAADCLRAKPQSAIMNNSGESAFITAWAPVSGDAVLPEDPGTAFRNNHINHVPVINGTTHDEMNLALGFTSLVGVKVTDQTYTSVLNYFGPSLSAQVQKLYPLSAYAAPDFALASILTDVAMVCPSYQSTQLLAADGISVHGYEFWDPTPWGYAPGVKGSGHGSDMAYEFGYPVFATLLGVKNPKPPTAAQRALSDTMIGYWWRMASTGDPNGGNAPNWPAFTAAMPDYQELTPTGVTPNITMDERHHCDFWTPLEGSLLGNPNSPVATMLPLS